MTEPEATEPEATEPERAESPPDPAPTPPEAPKVRPARPPRSKRFPAGDPAVTDRLATIGQRILARLLDAVIIGVPAFLLVLSTSEIDEARRTVRTPLWAQLVATGIAAVYEVVLIRQRGQTVGKRALGIEVVRETDGQHPDWTASIMRYLLPVLPALVPVPGLFLLSPVIYLVAIADPLRRGWHDRAAGTIVIKAGQPPPPTEG
ncbi:MAG TPA: RDD family protein [Acidimicrobiales bacterium]|nr:RDD family protein [Acidimicrobiales bacterium]